MLKIFEKIRYQFTKQVYVAKPQEVKVNFDVIVDGKPIPISFGDSFKTTESFSSNSDWSAEYNIMEKVKEKYHRVIKKLAYERLMKLQSEGNLYKYEYGSFKGGSHIRHIECGGLNIKINKLNFEDELTWRKG